MKSLHQTNKKLLLASVAGIVLISSALISCGGAKENASDVAVAADNTTPVVDGKLPDFDLKGFKFCGDQGATLTFKTKTHVAYGLKSDSGLESDNRLVYLFNQTKPLLLQHWSFGNDPIPPKYKKGYCKEVTSDNNDVEVFNAALTSLESHMLGKVVLSSAQLQLQNERLKQTMHAAAANESTLLSAFSVITAYEKMRGGAFFQNEATKGGFDNEYYNKPATDIDRAVLAIQQSIHDSAYEASTFVKFKDVLKGKKFNSSDWFPGKVKEPAKPDVVYSVKINATMVKDVDIRTAYSSTDAVARRPTGYYLAAGDIAKVTVPVSMVGKNFVIRVGANIHDKATKSTISRPFRVTTKFPIENTVTEIGNPNGGGIYIDVPYLANAGNNVEISIQNVVPAPFFSATTLNKVTLKQWQNVQRKNPAPWADFMTDKFMMTLPTKWITNYDDPEVLMKDWDDRMDKVSALLGKNALRNNQTLYLIPDTSLLGDAYGIGYPTGNNPYYPGDAADGNSKKWYLTPGKNIFETEFHELGHAQLPSNFPGEGEAIVNLLSIAVVNQLYEVDIDEALGRSMNNTPFIGRPEAAINWMTTPNFRAGNAMDISHSTKDEVQYQQRGYAKYVEIAALFGWDKLEKFYLEENRVFRGEATDAGRGLDGVDSRILRMSIAAGVDLTPLIHFWGVQPVEAAKLSAAITAANLKPSLAIYNRLKVYQGIIPMDNASFKVHAAKFLDKPANLINGDNKSPDYAEGWYAVWLNKYSLAEGQAAQAAFDKIFARYFPAGKPV
jgi:N-terminal domain of M60-like peptidases/Peptidase M60, enhancin and enhancin-like